GFRDCTQKKGKKDQKIYFQFSQEYYNLVNKKYSYVLEEYGFFKLFLEYLHNIDIKAKMLLNSAIGCLNNDFSNLGKVLYKGRNELTVILKIIKYYGNGELCTPPHYDKSGLTLVLDNNDMVNDRFI